MYLLQALQDACPNAPWALTFSYGRALQSSTLKVAFLPQLNRHLLNEQDAEVWSAETCWADSKVPIVLYRHGVGKQRTSRQHRRSLSSWPRPTQRCGQTIHQSLANPTLF